MNPARYMKKVYRLCIPGLNGGPGSTRVGIKAPGQSIPRFFYQIYLGDTVPPVFTQGLQAIAQDNPDWTCRLYRDSDAQTFIRTHYGSRIAEYYLRICPEYAAARADLLRYLLIYQYGGVYMDVKSRPRRPLNEVIQDGDQLLLSYWHDTGPDGEFPGYGKHVGLGPLGELQQWFVAAAPGHPAIKAVINNILRNIECYLPQLHEVGRHGVLQLTGPIAFTKAITPLLPAVTHRLVNSNVDLDFDYCVRDRGENRSLYQARHYSELSGSIVQLSRFNSLRNGVLGKIKSVVERIKA